MLITETRQKALKWWNKLSKEEQVWLVLNYGEGKVVGYNYRELDSLTGREIELLWDYSNKVFND